MKEFVDVFLLTIAVLILISIFILPAVVLLFLL